MCQASWLSERYPSWWSWYSGCRRRSQTSCPRSFLWMETGYFTNEIVLLQAGGDTFPLMGNSGTVLGMALKSHDHSTKPLYVSVGHRISLEVAVRLTHHCCRFRIPEPIRQADIRSREYIRRTLGHPGSQAQRQERSQKEQGPKACPKGSPGSPADQGRPPKDCDRGPSTDPKDPQPGFQEQPKAQQSEGTGHHEDSDLWPPPAWL
ncbi:endonuclease V-like isoform X3 [Microtus pennsylvanicus]|uniref:endonuclease V-like isoform X3 n=1 Tax=Microtus pennsylvanicus TaxID=10058 RepID=UPI003F6C77A7